MSYPINYPTPQGANIQIFKEGGTTSDWVKPHGASFVWFTLIGAGSAYDTTVPRGGGSGAVTNCMVPAFLIPDTLEIVVAAGQKTADTAAAVTYVRYRNKNAYNLLSANGGQANGGGGSGSSSTPFAAMGIYQSVGGQAGVLNVDQTASATTFLSGGTSGGFSVTANYGYSITSAANNGFFQMQPIMVGLGSNQRKGGTGCGGGYAATNQGGGDGMVVIITW